MESFQRRLWKSPKSIRGQWALGPDKTTDHMIYQLELPWLDNTPFVSCIPSGRYELVMEPIAPHPHMQTVFGSQYVWLPLYKDVPGRSACFCHPANSPKDILGCTAPGLSTSVDWVGDSHAALALLMGAMQVANARGEGFYVTITDEF